MRSAEVKTMHGVHRRPIIKLILLVPYDEKTRKSPACWTPEECYEL